MPGCHLAVEPSAPSAGYRGPLGSALYTAFTRRAVSFEHASHRRDCRPVSRAEPCIGTVRQRVDDDVQPVYRSDMRNQGGDRGKSPNVTGTQPRKRVDAPAPKPGRKSVKAAQTSGVGRGKHAAKGASGAKTSQTRKAGPKKVRRGTTTRSGDR
jgi:hypothetical protein